MSGWRQRPGRRGRSASSATRRARAPLAFVLAFLALFAQWLAPAAHSIAAPSAPASAEAIAADLKGTFGDAAVLCIQSEEENAPSSPVDHRHHGDECCPLCQLQHCANGLIAPSLAALPARREFAGARARFAARDRLRREFPRPLGATARPALRGLIEIADARLARARVPFLQFSGLPHDKIACARALRRLRTHLLPRPALRPPSPTPCAGTASSPPRSASTIPASATNLRCRPSRSCRPTASGRLEYDATFSWTKTIFPGLRHFDSGGRRDLAGIRAAMAGETSARKPNTICSVSPSTNSWALSASASTGAYTGTTATRTETTPIPAGDRHRQRFRRPADQPQSS